MGQHVSACRSNNCNDELVNFLIIEKHITSENVEKVFRSVDRGFYFRDDEKCLAYNNTDYRSDGIHLSAPTVYATALERLKLQWGHKFLNIGSGVGYFSTIVGLMLGISGVNHGIEINKLLIDRAKQKMEEFKLHSAAIDFFNFCEPVFIHGNACDLSPKGYYDRVYCGARVPPKESEFMKSLINIGGILIMPLGGSLMKITRETEDTWKSEEILECLITDLVVPEKCSINTLAFPTVAPSSLKQLCKLNVRTILRENLGEKDNDLLTFPSTSSHTENTADKNLIEEVTRLYGGGADQRRLHDLANSLLGAKIEVCTYVNAPSSDDGNDDSGSDLEQLDDNSYELVREGEVEDADGTTITARVTATARNSVIHYAQCSHRESASIDEPSTSSPNESIKRKSQDCAEGSEPNTASAATTNSKRMKMDSTSQNSESEPSTSLERGSGDSWTTVSINPEGLVSVKSFGDDDDEDDSDDDDGNEGMFKVVNLNLCHGRTEGSENESCVDDGLQKPYRFATDRKENKLSKCLKSGIDSLPIPNALKLYLNYNRID